MGAGEKHKSPTKRLIEQRNAIVAHKEKMKEISPEKYHINYNTGTSKSYIIEPHLGEMNYELAEEDPLRFYDEMFVEPITRHKIHH
jgi:hypothetical protein